MSVIVTGGRFIGSNLVIKLLNIGEEVTIVDNFSLVTIIIFQNFQIKYEL